MSWQKQQKKKGKIPLRIKGLNATIWITRKQALLGALIGVVGIVALAAFLVYIQTVPVCNFVFVGC